MPNSLNDHIQEIKRLAMEQGLGALSDDDRLLMFTVSHVHRGVRTETEKEAILLNEKVPHK